MVATREGWSTCREHGGEYAGDVGALDHLTEHHSELVDRLKRYVVLAVPEGADPEHVIDRATTLNRAQRRKAARCAS